MSAYTWTFSEACEIKLVYAQQDAEVATDTSTIVDVSDCQGCFFITEFGTPAADNTLKIQQRTGAPEDWADLADSEVASGTSASVWVDIRRAGERKLRAVLTRATSSTLGSTLAIKYGLRNQPADNDTTGTITGIRLDGPAEA